MTQDQDLVGKPEFIEQFFVPWHSPGNPWDGLPMARIGWRLQMYWREPASPAKRRALLAITEEYLDRAAGQLQRYVVGGGPENFIFLKPGERPSRMRATVGTSRPLAPSNPTKPTLGLFMQPLFKAPTVPTSTPTC